VKNIYVGNLDLKTTAESLRSLFEPVGTVHNLKLILDRNTSLSRGFAFIEMTDREGDKAIAALNGRSLDGRVIDVHEGRPKLHRGGSPRRADRHDAVPDRP
jgi:RNA recognition motif-containing protein